MRNTTPPALRRTGLAALALTTGLFLAGCGTDDDTEPTAADPNGSSAPASETPSSPAPTTPAQTDDGDDGETDDGPTETVPVYFVGDSPLGSRLYREFHVVDADDPLGEAADLLVDGEALDPDYSTLLTGVDVESVDQSGGSIVVTLDADSTVDAAAGTSRADAALAVQSLVYTLQGVAQTRDPVQVVRDGAPVSLLGVDTTTGVKAKDPLDVLALVNVTAPEQGEVVSGSFTASGVASSFEGTVPWEVLDSSGASVLDGFATAEGYLDNLYPWETEAIDVSGLAPGDYTFVARTDDPSGGEGPGPFEDTKTFTVG